MLKYFPLGSHKCWKVCKIIFLKNVSECSYFYFSFAFRCHKHKPLQDKVWETGDQEAVKYVKWGLCPVTEILNKAFGRVPLWPPRPLTSLWIDTSYGLPGLLYSIPQSPSWGILGCSTSFDFRSLLHPFCNALPPESLFFVTLMSQI